MIKYNQNTVKECIKVAQDMIKESEEQRKDDLEFDSEEEPAMFFIYQYESQKDFKIKNVRILYVEDTSGNNLTDDGLSSEEARSYGNTIEVNRYSSAYQSSCKTIEDIEAWIVGHLMHELVHIERQDEGVTRGLSDREYLESEAELNAHAVEQLYYDTIEVPRYFSTPEKIYMNADEVYEGVLDSLYDAIDECTDW